MIASRLKELRKIKKMTLEELAFAVGTSRQTIHRYENGIITNIPPSKIVAIANALGTTPSDLMGWDGDSSNLDKYDNVLPLSTKPLPIIGDIACGEPIYAEQQYESFAATGDICNADFCLRARGDSMVGARIFDGDIVFIHAQSAVDNGEIAAVIINDEATLKRVYYYPNEAKLILSPENPKYAPQVYIKEELDTIKIIGKAVAFQSSVV